MGLTHQEGETLVIVKKMKGQKFTLAHYFAAHPLTLGTLIRLGRTLARFKNRN